MIRWSGQVIRWSGQVIRFGLIGRGVWLHTHTHIGCVLWTTRTSLEERGGVGPPPGSFGPLTWSGSLHSA